jgi:transposase
MITKKAGRPNKRPNKAELEMKYQAMTATELAAEYGVAVSTVRNWIRAYRKEDEQNGTDNGTKK